MMVGVLRGDPHTGTETRTRLLREAAVRNIGQWSQDLNQPCRVQDDGPMDCKLLLYRKKPWFVFELDGTVE